MSEGDHLKAVTWKPRDAVVLSVIEANGDLWFSTKTLGALFGVTTQNIQIHIRDLRDAGQSFTGRLIAVAQAEGMRSITRRIKHYSFEVAHAIAIRSQRFEELNSLLDLARQNNIAKPAYRVAPIKERAFGELLLGALNGITPILPQHHVPPHFLDFFLPEWRLAIEYDERHHGSARQMLADAERQATIEQCLGASFVRVSVGQEIEALNRILKIGIRISEARHE